MGNRLTDALKSIEYGNFEYWGYIAALYVLKSFGTIIDILGGDPFSLCGLHTHSVNILLISFARISESPFSFPMV